MKSYSATLTGKRDNRKFNRIRNLFAVLAPANIVVQYVSYRPYKNRSGVSIALAVKSNNKSQMIRIPFSTPMALRGVLRKNIGELKELNGIK